jgi:hypothetical protein
VKSFNRIEAVLFETQRNDSVGTVKIGNLSITLYARTKGVSEGSFESARRIRESVRHQACLRQSALTR